MRLNSLSAARPRSFANLSLQNSNRPERRSTQIQCNQLIGKITRSRQEGRWWRQLGEVRSCPMLNACTASTTSKHRWAPLPTVSFCSRSPGGTYVRCWCFCCSCWFSYCQNCTPEIGSDHGCHRSLSSSTNRRYGVDNEYWNWCLRKDGLWTRVELQ